jgi:3-deoxy-manno-octulosonate cytidylyltransferase (CMP-KDO synthetase)
VLVATPDERICRVVEIFGGNAVLTSSEHRSGTDRLAEAAASLDADVIVNVQGDEPLIEPANIVSAVEPFSADASIAMTSLMCVCPPEERDNPATVKVVCDLKSNGLYFSRSRIPFPRGEDAQVMQHIGLYAYRRDFLLEFARLPQTKLELAESLEQLRALEHGYSIRMVEVENPPLSVDTPEDLERVREIILGRNMESG